MANKIAPMSCKLYYQICDNLFYKQFIPIIHGILFNNNYLISILCVIGMADTINGYYSVWFNYNQLIFCKIESIDRILELHLKIAGRMLYESNYYIRFNLHFYYKLLLQDVILQQQKNI